MSPRACAQAPICFLINAMAIIPRRFLLIVFIAISQFSSAFMHSIMGVTLPPIGSELGASGVELGLTESVFLGASAALLLPIGRLADATDRNTLFKGGLIALAVTTVVIGFQPSMTGIVGARFLQGIAAAFLTATGMAIVADIAPRDQLGRMFGLAIGATYFGLASGPFFAGLVTTHLGWRWVFFLAALPPLTAFFLSRITLDSTWRMPVAKVNLRTSAILITAIAMFVAGSAMLGQTAYGYAFVALAAMLGAAFLVIERRVSEPLLDIDEVRQNRPLSRALMVQFLIYCGTVGTTFLLSVYLQVIRGYSPEATGHILVIGPVVMAVVAPLAGRLSDRISPNLICALGAVLVLCSVSLAAMVGETSAETHLIAIMLFQGLGFALFSAPNITIIMNSVQSGERSMASALSGLMRSLGMVVSMFVVTAAISTSLGTAAVAERPAEFLSVMTWSFVTFAALTVVAVMAAALATRSPAP